MEEKRETFTYTYSAKQQEEIERIRRKYLPQQEDRMEQLRRLDKSAEQTGTVAALAEGTVSTFLLGIGMCCTMVWTNLFVPGIVIGLAGIGGIAAAYPLYQRITQRQREKLAPEILKLTEELLRENGPA